MQGWVREKEHKALLRQIESDHQALLAQIKTNTNEFLAKSTGTQHDRELQIEMFNKLFPETSWEFLTIEEVPIGFHPGIWPDGSLKSRDFTRIRFL